MKDNFWDLLVGSLDYVALQKMVSTLKGKNFLNKEQILYSKCWPQI